MRHRAHDACAGSVDMPVQASQCRRSLFAIMLVLQSRTCVELSVQAGKAFCLISWHVARHRGDREDDWDALGIL